VTYKNLKNLIKPQQEKITNFVVKLLILFELSFFISGISSTLITTQEFWIFSHSFSVLGALDLFYKEKEFALFLLIFIFGVFAPLLKMLLKIFNFNFMVALLHRFTFLDIFLVAILIYVAKSSSIIDADVGVGFWYLLTSLAISYLQMFIIFITNKQELIENPLEVDIR
jgi:hypothetical protein